MNYRPYPDVDRALAQMERGRVPESLGPLLGWIDEHLTLDLAPWQRHYLNEARSAGKSAITAAIVDQAVKAGEHVHVATRDGVRCAGGDSACSLPRTEPDQCPDCTHAAHAPGTECEAGVDHGLKRWHRCLCLAAPGASKACPPQMNCQGGTLGYADIVHLREGGSLRGADGVTITPDVLAEPYGDAEVTGE